MAIMRATGLFKNLCQSRGVATLELLVAGLLVGSAISVSGLMRIHSDDALTRALAAHQASVLLEEWLTLHALSPELACAAKRASCYALNNGDTARLDHEQAVELLDHWEQQVLNTEAVEMPGQLSLHASEDYSAICWQQPTRAIECLVRDAAVQESDA
jgi:hypothetical protein